MGKVKIHKPVTEVTWAERGYTNGTPAKVKNGVNGSNPAPSDDPIFKKRNEWLSQMATTRRQEQGYNQIAPKPPEPAVHDLQGRAAAEAQNRARQTYAKYIAQQMLGTAATVSPSTGDTPPIVAQSTANGVTAHDDSSQLPSPSDGDGHSNGHGQWPAGMEHEHHHASRTKMYVALGIAGAVGLGAIALLAFGGHDREEYEEDDEFEEFDEEAIDSEE